jgi:hypothetical protein
MTIVRDSGGAESVLQSRTQAKWAATTSPSSAIWVLSVLIRATCAETMAA